VFGYAAFLVFYDPQLPKFQLPLNCFLISGLQAKGDSYLARGLFLHFILPKVPERALIRNFKGCLFFPCRGFLSFVEGTYNLHPTLGFFANAIFVSFLPVFIFLEGVFFQALVTSVFQSVFLDSAKSLEISNSRFQPPLASTPSSVFSMDSFYIAFFFDLYPCKSLSAYLIFVCDTCDPPLFFIRVLP